MNLVGARTAWPGQGALDTRVCAIRPEKPALWRDAGQRPGAAALALTAVSPRMRYYYARAMMGLSLVVN